MTSGMEGHSFSPWEGEGRRQALSLDGTSFVLVIGDEPVAAAEVALGMARVQARRRRVIIADAVGLLSPIDDLVPFDAPRGIADVFVDGAPIGEVAHAAEIAGNLLVLPSGPGVLDRARLFFSEKWTEITDEFRAAETLLLVVAPEREPALDAVLPLVDGVVLVGRTQPIANVRALAYVRGPGLGARPSTQVEGSSIPDMPALKPQSRPGAIQHVVSVRRPPPPKQRSRWWLVALFALSLAGEGGWWWWHHRPGAAAPEEIPAAADSSATEDSTPPEAAPAAAVAPDTTDPSAGWAVVFGSSTSVTGANARLTQDVIRDLPSVTFAPADDSAGNRVFLLIAGAYRDRTRADSLLAALRAIRTLTAKGGAVVHLPYAVLVQSGLTHDDASFYLAGLRSKGLPVYQLLQDDGTYRLYAGAFARPADAQLLVATVRANGESAGVTYRIGRTP